jgi:hypothetical protein
VWSNQNDWQGKSKDSKKPAPVPLCPPQIPHDLAWAWTGAATVGSRRLTAWATTRPSVCILTLFASNLRQGCLRFLRFAPVLPRQIPT